LFSLGRQSSKGATSPRDPGGVDPEKIGCLACDLVFSWCATSAFAVIIFLSFGKTVNLYSLDTPMATFDLATSLWILFNGIRTPPVG
jgi:hypothetical protein